MALDGLTALANEGAGSDVLAGRDVSGKFVSAVMLTDENGTELVTSDGIPTTVQANLRDWAPGYTTGGGGTIGLTADPDGAFITRGSVLTDEGSARINFANSSLAVSIGTATFTNGSATVTGTGFSSRVMDKGDYIKLDADTEASWAQIESINTDSTITLVNTYAGTGGTGAASRAMVDPVTGTGGTIAVASGVCTLQSGTTINQTTSIERLIDYSPLGVNFGITVSQRIANNDTYIEIRDPSATAKYFCRIRLTGTTNTAAICETGYNPTSAPSASETESSTVTLPNAATTAAARVFLVESLLSSTRYYCDNVLIAEHRRVGPHPNDPMLLKVSTVNGGSAPATSTTVTVDHLLAQNFNAINVSPSSRNDLNANQPPVDTFNYSGSGVIAINTNLLTIDCARYRSISATLAVGTTGVVTPQWSNTADFAIPFTAFSADGSVANLSTQVATAGVLRTFRVRARYLRFRLTTATTAGTTSIVAICSQSETSFGGETITATVSQTQANEGSLVTPTASNINSAATTNATSVKASAGTLYAVSASNINAAIRYLKFYNKASAPTVGADVPILTIAIPAGGNVNLQWGRVGLRFTTGIALAITTGATDADTGAVAASEIKVNSAYI